MMKRLTISVSAIFIPRRIRNIAARTNLISTNSLVFYSFLVTKPSSKSHERPPPPRPSQPAPPRTSIPPPNPKANPPARPANPPIPVTSQSDVRKEPIGTNAMPDIAQPEVDLLNVLPRSNNNNNDNKSSGNIPAKEASFDLLGSFETAETTAPAASAMPDLLSDSQVKSSQGLDDLFGAFAPTNSNNTAAPASNLSDLNNLGLNFNATTAAPASNFDPFGNASAFIGNAGVLRPTSTDTSPSSSSQSKPPPNSTASTNKDPFADIANLASGLNLGWGSQQSSSSTTATAAPSKPTTVPSPHTTQFSSPTHQFGGFVPNPTNQARSPMENQPSSQKPDYNRSHFETKPKQNGAGTNNNSNGASTTGAAPTGGTGDIFADILGQQGYNFATKSQLGPRSINEMRKEELIKDMDPDKLKIMEWVSSTLFLVQNGFCF